MSAEVNPTDIARGLSVAELSLVADLALAPILPDDADMRRPFDRLQEFGIAKHNGTSRGLRVWALTPLGQDVDYVLTNDAIALSADTAEASS